MESIIITARAKAFSSESMRRYRFKVDADGVRVWDSVAGHYTACHSLSSSAIKRIIKAATDGRVCA